MKFWDKSLCIVKCLRDHGLITLDTKRAGKRSAANPHAAFDEAGAGNGTMGRIEASAEGESRRQTATPHSYRDRASSRPYNLPLPVPIPLAALPPGKPYNSPWQALRPAVPERDDGAGRTAITAKALWEDLAHVLGNACTDGAVAAQSLGGRRNGMTRGDKCWMVTAVLLIAWGSFMLLGAGINIMEPARARHGVGANLLLALLMGLDVRFISSLPVVPRPACTSWVDKKPAQIVGVESQTRHAPDVVDDVSG
jgi:hypothetical protein